MICVVLFTYNRPQYAEVTLASVGAYLSASEGIWLHLADDGSPQEQRDDLYEMARRFWPGRVSVSNSERRGYGGSYNLASQVSHVKADIILPLEDDWRLTRPLNLDPLAQVLRTDPRIACVRMGYLGTTQPLYGEIIHSCGQTFLLLHPDSPEPHAWAGHPRLETRDFQRRVGPWPERMKAGATEFEVAHRRAARTGVAWPLGLCLAWGDLWAHIGTIPSETAAERGDAESEATPASA